MCHTTGGLLHPVFFFFRWNVKGRIFYFQKHEVSIVSGRGLTSVLMLNKRGKGSVVEVEAGENAKTTPGAGGKSVSEKSQTTYTTKNPLRNEVVNRHNISF